MQADPAVGFCEVSLWLNKRKTWLRIFKPRTTKRRLSKEGPPDDRDGICPARDVDHTQDNEFRS
jgi:hypothetical protein